LFGREEGLLLPRKVLVAAWKAKFRVTFRVKTQALLEPMAMMKGTTVVTAALAACLASSHALR
jgi:hypothetical protein